MSDAALPVVVNRGGGTASKLGDKLAETLEAAFREAGVAIDLHLVEGDKVAETVTGLSAPVIAVGGGDGTQGSAAATLAGGNTVLAVLPLGTRNHLARQLGIPLDLPGAAKAAAAGITATIDLARGNDRVFVNNASIGLYTRLVRERDRSSVPKWLGTLPAAWHVLRRLRSHPLMLAIDGEPRQVRTPLLFIGNNRYSLAGGRVGERTSLTGGVLSLFAVARKRPLGLVLFALRTLVGRADPARDFAALSEAREVIVEGRGAIAVAFDGEVELMDLPLRFEIMPGALKVKRGAPADRRE
ncbi:MAG: diacylglycerol kinase family protein [Croceibacterium sp.]